MAGFCTKCGAPLPSSTGFCPACGTQIGSADVPPPPGFAAAPPAYSQMAAYPPLPPRPNSTLNTVLIVIAAIVGACVLGVGALGFIGWHAMHSGGNSVQVGSSANVSESDLGVSIYPAAEHLANGSVKVKVGNMLTVTSTYTTSDPASSVVSYYQDKMGNMTTSQNGRATTLTSFTLDGNMKESIVVTVTPSLQDGGPTKIMIAHTRTN